MIFDWIKEIEKSDYGEMFIKCNICNNDNYYYTDCEHKQQNRKYIFECFKELFYTVINSNYGFVDMSVLQCISITCFMLAYKTILGYDMGIRYEDTGILKVFTKLTDGACTIDQIKAMERDILTTIDDWKPCVNTQRSLELLPDARKSFGSSDNNDYFKKLFIEKEEKRRFERKKEILRKLKDRNAILSKELTFGPSS